MNPATVDVKHDAKVNGYATQNRKAVDEGPVGGVQRDLTDERWRSAIQEILYNTVYLKP